MGAKQRANSGVGHNTSSQYSGIGHQEYCIRAVRHARANVLYESAENVGKGTYPHVFVGSANNMVKLMGAAGDFVNGSIEFAVEVLLGSEGKTGDIGKEGASEGGRGKLCSGCRTLQQQKLSAGNVQRDRAKGVSAGDSDGR